MATLSHNLRTAIDAIKPARAVRDFGVFANDYIWKDDRFYASDGRMSASMPCPKTGPDCMLPGDELEALISRLGEDLTVTHNDEQSVTIRSGRMRGTLQTRSPDAISMLEPDGTLWTEPPPGLIQAMRLARPFVADVAAQPYATCLCLREGAILATTNITLVECACPGLNAPMDKLLPSWAADMVLRCGDGDTSPHGLLTGLILQENYCAFLWQSGLWVRSQLATGAFPAAVVALLAKVAPEQPLAIDRAWRQAYAAVAGISKGIVSIEPERIVGGRGRSQVVHECAPLPLVVPLEGPVHFNPAFASAVAACATHWDLSAYPAPVPFVGDGIKGLIVGRRA